MLSTGLHFASESTGEPYAQYLMGVPVNLWTGKLTSLH
jgi:hypothetical protein